MQELRLLTSLRSAALALVSAAALVGTAHAGLVSGNWDPQFGPALPNLSWQVRSNWLVPNGCSNAANGVYSTTALGGPCESTLADPVRLLSVWVRWFNTDAGDPNNFFQQQIPFSAHTGWCESVFASSEPNCAINSFNFSQGSEPLSASSVRVEQGQVVGFDTNITSFLTQNWPTSAGIHVFDLSFTSNGPVFTCRNSTSAPITPVTDPSCDEPVTASTAGLAQFLVTYTSNNASEPKFTDGQGNALGARLGSTGAYLGRSTSINGAIIPEPGALVLALTALAGVGMSRRRTQR